MYVRHITLNLETRVHPLVPLGDSRNAQRHHNLQKFKSLVPGHTVQVHTSSQIFKVIFTAPPQGSAVETEVLCCLGQNEEKMSKGKRRFWVCINGIHRCEINGYRRPAVVLQKQV